MNQHIVAAGNRKLQVIERSVFGIAKTNMLERRYGQDWQFNDQERTRDEVQLPKIHTIALAYTLGGVGCFEYRPTNWCSCVALFVKRKVPKAGSQLGMT